MRQQMMGYEPMFQGFWTTFFDSGQAVHAAKPQPMALLADHKTFLNSRATWAGEYEAGVAKR